MRWRSGPDLSISGLILFGLLSLSLSGCKPKEGWPWSRNMFDSPALQPQQRALDIPENTLPVAGGELTGFPVPDEGLVNPIEAGLRDEDGEEGKALFGKYCAACHGFDAKGRELTEDMATPDLTDPDYRDYDDTDFYSIIVDGGLIMPNYRAELSIRERWLVVGYLRTLPEKDGE